MKAWYIFFGGDDPTDVSNYRRINVKHTCLCGTKICVIYADDNGLQPGYPLSSNIQTYINDALATQLIQPEFPYCAKKFVYLKD